MDGTVRSASPCDFSRFGIVGNLDHPLRSSSDTVYLTEGPRDSAALIQEGLWGVHLFGHAPALTQVMRLQELPHHKVLLLDADVPPAPRRRAEPPGWPAWPHPQGDPGDHAGRLAPLVASAWAQHRSDPALGPWAAAVRQRLHNPQLRRSRATRRTIKKTP